MKFTFTGIRATYAVASTIFSRSAWNTIHVCSKFLPTFRYTWTVI